MSAVSLALVLTAAAVHATWNLFAKRAGASGPAFVWLFGMLSTIAYVPVTVAALILIRPRIAAPQVVAVLGSGILHTAYFTLLQRGYRHGELSVVYPIARGTGPLLSSTAAIVLLGERPGAQALVGGLLICLGVVLLSRVRSDSSSSRNSVGLLYGIATGCLIATYTLWDKRAVTTLALPALILDWGANFVRTALLTPVAIARRGSLRELWRAHRREIVGVALLAPLAYILVLTALATAPVSYIAPAREVSLLIGAAFGMAILKERAGPVRILGAIAIVVGLVTLATS